MLNFCSLLWHVHMFFKVVVCLAWFLFLINHLDALKILICILVCSKIMICLCICLLVTNLFVVSSHFLFLVFFFFFFCVTRSWVKRRRLVVTFLLFPLTSLNLHFLPRFPKPTMWRIWEYLVARRSFKKEV